MADEQKVIEIDVDSTSTTDLGDMLFGGAELIEETPAEQPVEPIPASDVVPPVQPSADEANAQDANNVPPSGEPPAPAATPAPDDAQPHAQQPVEPTSAPAPAPVPVASTVAPPVPSVPPVPPVTQGAEHLTDIERAAVAMAQRNPDMSLAQCIEVVQQRTDAGKPAEPSLDERIAELRQKIVDAGKNGSIFDDDVASTVLDYNDLIAQKAVADAQAQRNEAANDAVLKFQHQQSRQRVLEMCPDVAVEGSPIYNAIGKTIDELEGNPILLSPNAPEKIYFYANLLLPENQRGAMVRKAADVPPVQPVQPVQAPPATPTPTGTAPQQPQIRLVSGSATSAQHSTTIQQKDSGAFVDSQSAAALKSLLFGNDSVTVVL